MGTSVGEYLLWCGYGVLIEWVDMVYKMGCEDSTNVLLLLSLPGLASPSKTTMRVSSSMIMMPVTTSIAPLTKASISSGEKAYDRKEP